jgi:hypothetical protein
MIVMDEAASRQLSAEAKEKKYHECSWILGLP